METQKLKDCCTIIVGRPSNRSASTPEESNGLPAVRIADFGYIYPTTKQHSSTTTQVAEKDDILMITVGEKAGMVNLAQSEITIGNGVIAIRPSAVLHPYYVFCYLKSIESHLSSMATGTVMKRLMKATLEEIELPVPSSTEQMLIAEQFSNSVTNIQKLQAAISLEKEKLSNFIKSTFK